MSLTSERKAIGSSIEQSRRATGKQITDDLNRLISPKPKSKPLATVPKRGALPAQAGVGKYKATTPASTGGGIASPLTEPDVSKRQYWDTGLQSSDGLFFVPAIKQLSLTDSNGDPVVINLAQPAHQ